MSGPSDKAVEAAARGLFGGVRHGYYDAGKLAQFALRAGHDPALGLDRSVCLRDGGGSAA